MSDDLSGDMLAPSWPNLVLYMQFLSLRCYFLYLNITSISHGVENYFPRLWGTGISDVILMYLSMNQCVVLCEFYCIYP